MICSIDSPSSKEGGLALRWSERRALDGPTKHQRSPANHTASDDLSGDLHAGSSLIVFIKIESTD